MATAGEIVQRSAGVEPKSRRKFATVAFDVQHVSNLQSPVASAH